MRRLIPLVSLLVVTLSPAQAAKDPYSRTRQEFLAAYQRATTGVPAREPADSKSLRTYPLYPYLQAERLRRVFEAASGTPGPIAADPETADFLAAQGDEPVARALRRSWLASLAERAQWEVYLAHYRESLADATLACHELSARLALGRTEGLAAAVTAQWLTPRSAPEACDPAFDWLRAQGGLGADLIERRARLALDAGEAPLARWLARSLPDPSATPIRLWASLVEQPRATIDRLIAQPRVAVEPQALLAGWSRLARRDPDAARERYESLRRARKLDDITASSFARELALGMSWSRRSGSLRYFAQIRPRDFDDLTHEWHARAALWAGDWRRTAEAIAAMPQALAEQTRWRYWAARAAEQLGDVEKARELYAAVMPTDNFYAALSAARSAQPFEPRLERLELDPSQITQLAQQPAFERARELWLAGLELLSEGEWVHGYGALSAQKQVQAVGLAAEWGWFYQAIATAARQQLFNDYEVLYPRPFEREVRAAAGFTDLPVELIYGVLRQESLYRPEAVSSAGAVGLLQLLPSTARLTARQWQRPAPRHSDLLEPAVNVQLGAATLRGHLDRFDGRTTVALAAYNAGPAAAQRWLPPAEMDADVWVENIPYNETRGYVQRVLWHSLVFAWLRDATPQDASAWLAPIAPAGETGPTRVADAEQ